MTLSHNSLIRGYNGIYQQAPKISMRDYPDFIGYCLAWHRLVESHHYFEEIHFFPAIEKATGQKGVMDGEVEEHGSSSLITLISKYLILWCSCFSRGLEKLQRLPGRNQPP
jgi:hypothetical protein